jgi:hypothetical protein
LALTGLRSGGKFGVAQVWRMYPLSFVLAFSHEKIYMWNFSKRSMRSKKGFAGQTDWAISLAIFLLFTLWFFVVLRQYAPSDSRMESQVMQFEDVFKDTVSFEYSQVPIYVRAGTALSNVPVLVRNPINWTNYTLGSNIYTLRDDENIFFISDVDAGITRFLMKHSEEGYQPAYPGEYLYNTTDSVIVDSKQYTVRLPENTLEEIFFESDQHLYDFNFTMNDEYQEVLNTSRYIPTVFAKYNTTTDWFRIRSYVFPENSYILNLFDVLNYVGNNVSFSLEFTVPMFDEYYLDDIVPYSVEFSSGCIQVTSDVLDLSGNSSLTFIFSKDVDFELCDATTYEREMILVTASFDYSPSDVSPRTEFVLFSHDGTYLEKKDDVVIPVNMDVGIRERFTGISKTKLSNLATKTDDELLQLWNVSNQDFEVTVTDLSREELFSFQTSEPGATDVFSRTFSDYLINEFGDREFVFVNIKTW